MTLKNAEAGREYTIKNIVTYDQELDAFLFSLGCYSGERITVISNARWRAYKIADGSEVIRGAELDISKFINDLPSSAGNNPMWIALEVVDKSGKIARTRAYFRDELVKKS